MAVAGDAGPLVLRRRHGPATTLGSALQVLQQLGREGRSRLLSVMSVATHTRK